MAMFELPAISSSKFNYIYVFFAFVTCCWFVQYHWKKRKLYEFSWKINGPFAWPVIGNALMFSGSTEDIYKSLVTWLNKYSTPTRGWLGPRLFVFISKPKDLEIILNNSKSMEKDYLYRYARVVVGTGLFTASVDKWRRHRRIIMPTFNQKILETFMEVFVEQSNIFVENMKYFAGKEPIDIFQYVCLCTLDIVCETAMGIKVHAQNHESRFVKLANRAMKIVYLRMFQFWFHFDFIFNLFPIARELQSTVDELHEFTDKVIKQKRAELQDRLQAMKQNPQLNNLTDDITIPKRKAFLELLLELSEDGSKFTDEELREEVDTLMIAGSDTTASMNSFVFMMLGAHEEIQHQVFVELDEVFQGSDRSLTCEDLPKLQYLERVIKETMRLFPVGPAIVRNVIDDIKLETCTIPKGASALLGIIHTHRDPNIWPDPLRFDPDRFLPEEVAKRHPYSYVPFSGGPRNCIGTRYAMMAMKALISTFLRTYKMKSKCTVDGIRLKADLMLKPVDGYIVQFELRK